jgi:hypothetical protein
MVQIIGQASIAASGNQNGNPEQNLADESA